MAREGHYFKVLQRETRILGDYEQVHFRRSSVVKRPPTHVQPSPLISIAPRRPSRSQYVTFNKQTAALFLRQTESLWLNLDLTRQGATELLFDRPIGSFIVRGSQKAKYALSLRIMNEGADDTAVKHFLIQTNQQKFLTIQGSNLPFISIYDLLAYFCFHRSGGMPCCLKPPNPSAEGAKMDEGSESSDSDSESEQGGSASPPQVPPRTASMTSALPGSRASTDSEARPPQVSPAGSASQTPRKKPPPKPPRPMGGFEFDDMEEEELSILTVPDIQLPSYNKKIPPPIRIKPSLSTTTSRAGTSVGGRIIPPPMRRRSRSSECVLDRTLERPRTSSSPSNLMGTLEETKTQSKRKVSVSALIDHFESKSPTASPKRERKGNHLKASATLLDERRRNSESVAKRSDVPIPPPKPLVIIPPVPPRPLSTDVGEGGAPVVPPRTPAPLLPPKPPGSLPPSRMKAHRRSLSDSNPVFVKEIMELPPLPPRVPPKARPRIADYEMMPYPRFHSSVPNTPREVETSTGGMMDRPNLVATTEVEDDWVRLDKPAGEAVLEKSDTGALIGDNVMLSEVDTSVNTKGWQISEPADTGGSKGTKWKPKPLGWAKKLHFRAGKRKPRKRMRKFILELAGNQNQEFGRKISEFITEMRSRSSEAHQKMLLEIRNFITAMHEYLLQHHQNDLNNCGMEGCDNAGHVLECALQEVILQPLSHFVYLRIEEYYATNGHLFQVQRSIHQGKLKTTEEMGIRPHLLVPSEKVIADMVTLINRMMKTSCAISKLEYLLEVVRLTYENIKDARQPKKSMNDLGADDFLPIFVWVLVQCGFTRAEIEAEYMWGLAHPSLFNGEGGYYLTTLTSAVNVLKELTNVQQPPPPQQQLPTMNNLQTELKVFFEDEHTGQYSSAYYLPIVPTMTAAEICEIIIERRQISEPESYALFTVVDGKASMLEEHERPQEIKLKWTLQRSLEQSLSAGPGAASRPLPTPTNQFFAFKLRTPGNS